MSWWSSKPSDTECLKKEIDQLVLESAAWKTKYEHLQLEVDAIKKRLETQPSTLLFYDGSIYQGEVDEHHLFHGKGIYIYADGTRYVGEWDHGLYHGQGVLYMQGWMTLYAHWDHHKLDGECWYHGCEKMYYDNGKKKEE